LKKRTKKLLFLKVYLVQAYAVLAKVLRLFSKRSASLLLA